MNNPRVIVALDFDCPERAIEVARSLDPADCRVKVGKELFTRAGPTVVEKLQSLGFEVFLDLKFHDIPNTVAGACRAAADLGVWMINVHALGGARMMAAAAAAVASAAVPPRLVAVTVLTSLTAQDLRSVGLPGDPEALALELARLAGRCGLDGVVCSPREAAAMRSAMGSEWIIVTPGVRSSANLGDDQRRTLGPREALEAGADYLVVGRPVTAADDPAGALRTILSELR